MRSSFLFPLSLSLIAVAGCGSQTRPPELRSDLMRDLTTVSQGSETAVATPIELGQVRAHTGGRSTVSSQRRVQHRAVSRSAVSAPKPVGITAVGAPAPAASPEPAEVQPTNTGPADPHELPPGKTVTIIPVSTGSSTSEAGLGPDEVAWPHYGSGGSGMGGGERAGGGSGMGGDCPRPDFGPRGGTRGLMY
jgi:hypothetical protein